MLLAWIQRVPAPTTSVRSPRCSVSRQHRNAIIHEAVSTLNEQGILVDVRHLMLVADMMCMEGEVKQIGRHGIAGEKESVLSRAAFEVTVNHLLDAAVANEVDELSGVTENVIVGQPIQLGTGDVKLIAVRQHDN